MSGSSHRPIQTQFSQMPTWVLSGNLQLWNKSEWCENLNLRIQNAKETQDSDAESSRVWTRLHLWPRLSYLQLFLNSFMETTVFQVRETIFLPNPEFILFLFSIVYKGPITKTPKRKFANLAVSFLYSLSNNFLELVFLGFGDFGPSWLLLKNKTPKNKLLINAVLFSVSVDRIPILLIWVSLSPRPLLCFKDFCSPKLQPDWRRMAVWWDMW